MTNFKFNKNERLKSRKIIGLLFHEGQSFGQYPLRLIWIKRPKTEEVAQFQFAATVPKRKFKSAVKRNRIRRQIKEAYRLHKHLLYEAKMNEDYSYAIMVLYTAKEPLPYDKIEEAMREVIRKFI